VGFDESTWEFSGERANADDKLVLAAMSLLYSERLPVIEEYRQCGSSSHSQSPNSSFLLGPTAATAAACAE
jgi:hypothetical protein